MAFPSIHAAVLRAGDTARRFPWTLAAGVIAAGVMIAAIEGPNRHWHFRAVVTAVIGLSLFTAIATATERAGLPPARRHWVGTLAASALVWVYIASLGWSDSVATLRFAQLLVAAHLLVAVLPYWRSGPQQGFWQFNRFLFGQFLLATLYTTVLWVGLAIALAAAKKLLGLAVPGESYAELWAFLAFVFHPWFMLSGVPRDYARLDELDDYPLGLKVFAQFVLIPLVTVYMVILTLYLGRIIVTRTWPSGWIGYLVSSVSAVGVLALLLVHPVRDRADSKWVNGYGRWFFMALLPPLVMLLMAVGKRIGQYGVTEPRYFLLVLALWLSGLALFYALSGSRNIRIIPLSLAGLALVTAVGPWGAYQVSVRSQLGRLGRIAAANDMGRIGALTRTARPVSADDQRELSAIFDYLYSRHGSGALAKAFGVPADTVLAFGAKTGLGDATDVPGGAMRRLGLRYTQAWERSSDDMFWFAVQTPLVVDVAGYDRLQPIALSAGGPSGTELDSLELEIDSTLVTITATRGADTLMTLQLREPLQRLVTDRADGNDLHKIDAPVVVEGSAGSLVLRLVLENVNGRRVDGRIALNSASGYILVGRR